MLVKYALTCVWTSYLLSRSRLDSCCGSCCRRNSESMTDPKTVVPLKIFMDTWRNFEKGTCAWVKRSRRAWRGQGLKISYVYVSILLVSNSCCTSTSTAFIVTRIGGRHTSRRELGEYLLPKNITLLINFHSTKRKKLLWNGAKVFWRLTWTRPRCFWSRSNGSVLGARCDYNQSDSLGVRTCRHGNATPSTSQMTSPTFPVTLAWLV